MGAADGSLPDDTPQMCLDRFHGGHTSVRDLRQPFRAAALTADVAIGETPRRYSSRRHRGGAAGTLTRIAVWPEKKGGAL
jgi:hypothetical protein